MFDKLLKMSGVLDKPGFWIWHGCICKGDAEFQIYLIMAPYAPIMQNMPQYAWTWMNISENAWIKCFYCSRVLNIPRYSYSITINVTNIIILSILSARFVQWGALLPFCFFNSSWNIRIKKAGKFLINFSFWLQNVRAFKVFKLTARCIFKCETTKLKLAKNIKKGFLSNKFFV